MVKGELARVGLCEGLVVAMWPASWRSWLMRSTASWVSDGVRKWYDDCEFSGNCDWVSMFCADRKWHTSIIQK